MTRVMWPLAGALAALMALALPSGCGGDDECEDADRDGFGKGCAAGPDCDDDDAERTGECAVPDCEDDPFNEGCPCFTGSRRDCYDAPEDTLGLGACVAGRRLCLGGTWGACQDQVLPEIETCNGDDDDCDGRPDEGALSPCGGCDNDCVGEVWGSEAVPFVVADDLALDATGALTLQLDERATSSVWVPNTAEATVSRVAIDAAREEARYALRDGSAERVAVDHNGDAWVLTTSLTGRSSLLKVAGDASDCVDVDDDGLDTSSGGDDVLSRGSDDCVLLDVAVGERGEVARALAVDGTRTPDGLLGGNVWVGFTSARRVSEIDGNTGETLRSIATPGIEPYAAAFDPWGALWLLDRDGKLARLDRLADPPALEVHEVPFPCYALESLVSDRAGSLLLSGFSCENVLRYDPAIDHWRQVSTGALLTTRDITIVDDESWVVHTEGRLSRVQSDPLALMETLALSDEDFAPIESTGVASDDEGRLWVVSSMGGAGGGGLLTRFDPDEGLPTAQVEVGAGPRVLGDLTGTKQLFTFRPEASTSHVFGGCGPAAAGPDERVGPPTEWRNLHVVWTQGIASSVTVEARHAAAPSDLDDLSFTALGTLPDDEPPFALDYANGGVLEVRLTLRSGGRLGAPRVAHVGVEWHCPGPD